MLEHFKAQEFVFGPQEDIVTVHQCILEQDSSHLVDHGYYRSGTAGDETLRQSCETERPMRRHSECQAISAFFGHFSAEIKILAVNLCHELGVRTEIQ